MKVDVTRIVEILEREYGVYKDLLELSRKKTDVIAEGNITILTGMMGVEQRFVVELGHLEAQREQLIKEYAHSNGLKYEQITISNLISAAQGETKKRIKDLDQVLKEVIAQQKEVNGLNEQLIKSNLEFIDFSIRLIAGQDESGSTYAKGGQTAIKGQNRNLFDKKV